MNSQEATPELSKKEKRAIYIKKYNSDNKDKIREAQKKYLDNNKDKIKEYQKKYRNDHKDKLLNYRNENKDKAKKGYEKYLNKNKDKIREYQRIWQSNNKYQAKEYSRNNRDKARKRQREYCRNKRYTDIQYKLSCIIRSRLKHSLRLKPRVSSAIKELGCTLEELKLHLEAQFQPGMTWDNRGFYGWHIDHIKPLASFDLTDPEQFKQACHYSNLQPLWATDNLSKGAKIIDKKQSLEHMANTNQSPQTEDIGMTYIQAPKDPNGVEMNDC